MTDPLAQQSPPIQAGTAFSGGAIVRLLAGFLLTFAGAHLLVKLAAAWLGRHYGLEPDVPGAWPLSIFSVRMPAAIDLLVAVVVALLFALSLKLLERIGYRLGPLIVLVLLLLVGGNLVQGWANGFVTPTAGTAIAWKANLRDPLRRMEALSPKLQRELATPIQYYHDAARIEDPAAFLRDFTSIQADLRPHARTHPPGAVLVYYLLGRLLGHPGAISLAIGVISLPLSALFLYGVLRSLLTDDRLSRYMVLLFALLPAVQIYYLASLDALIATCMLASVYFALRENPFAAVAGMVAFLFASSFLTFGWVFLVPVLTGYAWVMKRERRVGLALLGLVLVYWMLRETIGFDYAVAFATASRIENPGGLFLFADPASYVFTRLEGVFEIAAFLGPFLALALAGGLRGRDATGRGARMLFWLAAATLLAMLLGGAFRTGETARACLFIWPYLLLPVAVALHRRPISPTGRKQLAALLFAQTLFMQTFGSYFW